jgi:hypothetical protein
MPAAAGNSESFVEGPDYRRMKVAELKEALSFRGLPVSGIKQDLIRRLEEADQEDSGPVQEKNVASAPENALVLSGNDVQELARLSQREVALERELASARVMIVTLQSERDRQIATGIVVGGGVGFGLGIALSISLGIVVGVGTGLATGTALGILIAFVFELGSRYNTVDALEQ